MRRLSSRDWKAIIFLSIVIPVSLLTTLRLTGIVPEPQTVTETTTLEAIKWEFKRPQYFMYINDRLSGMYNGDDLSATFGVVFGIYVENSTVRFGADYTTLGIYINSTTTRPNVSVESVYVVFHSDSQSSLVDWIQTLLNFQNLSLVGVASGWTNKENYREAYVRLSGLNHPERVNFWGTAEWSLLTPNTQTHQVELAFELTYYNGTAYKKMIQPFQLKIVGDE